jgi:hypothetical protein
MPRNGRSQFDCALRAALQYFLPSTKRGVPHISLVFREMWDATNLNLFCDLERSTWSAVVSHISRKTSEIWGTPRLVEGRKMGGQERTADPSLLAGLACKKVPQSDVFLEQHEMKVVPEWSAETVVVIRKG